jgi:hypothetical protein
VSAAAHAAAPAPFSGNTYASYVLIGENGQAVARAIVSGPLCPGMAVDGVPVAMATRFEPAMAPLRPKQAKPADFPVRVCEANLPAHAKSASVGEQQLPLPGQEPPRRIVVIGDTGCRIKTSDNAYQDCSSPDAWPFQEIANAAARERPDLVVHVGDYHYRESPCPPAMGCVDSPWGYGWDAWNADFFVPARNLLGAAPWVVTRGNHEECARAGQGWFRFLDPQARNPTRDCDRPENDSMADASEPYAVPIGAHWQLIVFDSARATNKPLDASNPADAAIRTQYESEMRSVARLAAVPGMRSIFISHHPVLGFSPSANGEPKFGNPALLEALRAQGGEHLFPPGIDAALHGHVHTFQAIDFASADPATIVAGHGGDNLDGDLPEELPARLRAAEGVRVDFVAHTRAFGYLVLQADQDGWLVLAQRKDGSSLEVCRLQQSHLSCNGDSAVSRPAPAG